MLFFHGIFLPPDCYTDKLATAWFEAISGDYDCVCLKSPRNNLGTVPPVVFEMFPDLREFPDWINSQKTRELRRLQGIKTYVGLEETLQFLQAYLNEQPRFDVLVGHSQGALIASILSLMIESEKDWLPVDKHWSAIVLFNAPGPYEAGTNLRERVARHGPMQIPSVHVFGGPTDYSWVGQQELRKVHHPDGRIVQHDGGHFFPQEQQYYDRILAELKELLA